VHHGGGISNIIKHQQYRRCEMATSANIKSVAENSNGVATKAWQS